MNEQPYFVRCAAEFEHPTTRLLSLTLSPLPQTRLFDPETTLLLPSTQLSDPLTFIQDPLTLLPEPLMKF
jgi:hypothetical protein